jgi:hypothetical protein
MLDGLTSNCGWVSVDFMVASLIIILTIPGLVSIAGENLNTANSVHKIAKAKLLTDNVAQAIEMVYTGGSGCSIIYKMPSNIDNKPYYFKINKSGAYIRVDGLMGSTFISSMKLSTTEWYDQSEVQMHADTIYNISNRMDANGNTHIIIKNI